MPTNPPAVHEPRDVYRLMKRIQKNKRENVYAILLDGERVMGIERIYHGAEALVDAYPDDVYRLAIERGCKSIIVVHNHPSGLAKPSWPDIKATRSIYRWGRNIGIDLEDSVIIAQDGYYSFKETGAFEVWGEKK